MGVTCWLSPATRGGKVVASNLRRGPMAGLLAGLFAFFSGEPYLEWNFRLSSLGSQLVFWTGLGGSLGFSAGGRAPTSLWGAELSTVVAGSGCPADEWS